MGSKTINKSKLLTAVELEFMNILWEMGKGSVNDVLDQLPRDRHLAYTSVSTILRILEQKGVVRSRKQGRSHIYKPLLSKEQYGRRSLQNFVTKVFDNVPLSLVRTLLDSNRLTQAELEELSTLINKKRRS